MTRLLLLVAILATAPATIAFRQAASTPCAESPLAGFRVLDDGFWKGPWVFDARRFEPFPAIALPSGQTTTRPVPVRLDDGSVGTLRVEMRPCRATEDCTPRDCGCPLDDESFWIAITNAAGQRVARLHLWAAYRIFQIVPLDLVDGPGDELVIVRVPAHASPPIGHDLKIWKVGASTPVDLGGLEHVAGTLASSPFACARFQLGLSVDLTAAKPRAIALRPEFAASACCRLGPEAQSRLAALRGGQTLRFDVTTGKYVAH